MVKSKPSYIFKVIVVGEGGVGKTTFINRFATNKFVRDTKITIGAGFYSFHLNLNSDNVIIKLQVWDFGGEKRFRFILPSYCQGAHGVIFTFDLTRASSLLNLSDWFDLVNANIQHISPVVVLIGTKEDKLDEAGAEAVNDAQIEEFMSKYKIPSEVFFRTSSKSGKNIKDVFTTLSDLLYAKVSELNA